jgi:hypothetical protein
MLIDPTVRNCAHNTAMKYLTNFRKIINQALVNEWIEKDPFVKFKGSKQEVKRDFLSEEEFIFCFFIVSRL